MKVARYALRLRCHRSPQGASIAEFERLLAGSFFIATSGVAHFQKLMEDIRGRKPSHDERDIDVNRLAALSTYSLTPLLCLLPCSVEWTLGTTRQVLNRQLFSSGQDLQIVIVFIHSHAYCHCRCILSSITYILTAIVMGIRNIQKLSAYQIQS